MKIQVTKVFANFINEVARENGKRFKASVDEIQEKFYRYYTGADPESIDFSGSSYGRFYYKAICIDFPADYYANEIYLSTAQLNQAFNRYGVKTVDDLKQMILDICEI